MNNNNEHELTALPSQGIYNSVKQLYKNCRKKGNEDMKTISVISQKGGVGKSTTSQALACYFSGQGYRTLLIDMDSQRNTSYYAKAKPRQHGILGVLNNPKTIESEIVESELGFAVIPSTQNTNTLDILLADVVAKENRLKKGLKLISDKFDICVIDTPPHLGTALINALTASDYAIIPTLTDIFSLQGILDLKQTIEDVKEELNESLEVLGILITRYNSRQILTNELEKELNKIADRMNTKVFTQKIRESVAIKERQLSRHNLIETKCKATSDYIELCKAISEEIQPFKE